jgi:hypothetical protein
MVTPLSLLYPKPAEGTLLKLAPLYKLLEGLVALVMLVRNLILFAGLAFMILDSAV